MNTLKLTITLLALSAFISCENSASRAQNLEQETMRIHDDAMKLLADMNRSSRNLSAEIPQLDSTAENNDRRKAIVEVLAEMEKADGDMMSWMSGFNIPENASAEEKISYLTEEKVKIEKNYQDIRAALERAQKLENK